MLLVRPTLPVKTVAELVEYCQAKSRQAHPRHLRRRQHQPFPGRAAEAQDRHHLDRGALPRQRAGDRRSDRRPCRCRLPAAHRLALVHRGRQAPRAGGAGAEARGRRSPTCRPSPRPAFPTCRASPSTAYSRRRARRRRWSTSSAPRSARRWTRKRCVDKLGELGSEARGSTPEEFSKFLDQRNREMDRRHAEGQHQGARVSSTAVNDSRAASVLAEDRPQLSQAEAEAAARRLRLPLPFHRPAAAVHAQAEPRVQPSRIRGHDVRGLGEDAGGARPIARPARALDDVRAQLRDRAARAEPLRRPHQIGDRAVAAHHRRRARHPHQGRRGRLPHHLAADQGDRPDDGRRAPPSAAGRCTICTAPTKPQMDGWKPHHPQDAGQVRAGAHGRRRSDQGHRRRRLQVRAAMPRHRPLLGEAVAAHLQAGRFPVLRHRPAGEEARRSTRRTGCSGARTGRTRNTSSRCRTTCGCSTRCWTGCPTRRRAS